MTKGSAAGRRYVGRFIPLMIAYVAAIGLAVWLFGHRPPAGPLAYLLAALPGLPVVGVIWAMGAYVAEETDEFERSVVVQSMLWGVGVSLSAASVWGFVENFTSAPRIPLYAVFIVFCAAMGVAQPFIRRRYR